MTDLVYLEDLGDIARVVLNRPERLNAFNLAMWERLGAVMEELGADDNLRCIVLRGADGKSFSPGNDISEFATDRSNPEQAKAYGEILHRTLKALGGCRHPTRPRPRGPPPPRRCSR